MFATARMIKLFYFLVFLCSAGDASLLRAVPTTAHPSKVATEERVWYLLPNGTMQHDKVKSLMCMLLHLAQPYYSCLRHSSSYISISMTRAAMYVLETLIHRCFSFLWLAVLTSSCMGTFSINWSREWMPEISVMHIQVSHTMQKGLSSSSHRALFLFVFWLRCWFTGLTVTRARGHSKCL